MDALRIIKKFVKSSSWLERTALVAFEHMPLSVGCRLLYGPAYFHWSVLLKESEGWSRDRTEAYQFEQLRNLLVHAKKKIPYYRTLFSTIGLVPEKIQDFNDMKIIPFLTKEYARDHAHELVDTGLPLDSLLHKPTSGSSGIPLNIYKTKETVASFFAFRVHILGRIGHTPKSREVMFWSMIELGKRTGIPFMEYGNRLVISGRHLTDDWLSQHYKKIRKFRPEFILGFPSTLSLLAAYIRKNDLPSLQGLKAIITYAETLYDWQRNLIGEVFGVRVFSMYALTEQAVIGGECEYSEAMHIQPLFGYTEPLRLREGYDELVSTGFTNYAMPFVRYRTGDLVAGLTGGCSQCGRHHQIAGRIEGRTDDFLVGKNGEIIPRLMPWIKRFDNVQCFQFFQEEPGRAYLKIVRSAKYSDDDTHVIRSKIDDMLGPMKNALDVDIVFVDGIPGTTSGKCKMVDQRLDMKKLLVS